MPTAAAIAVFLVSLGVTLAAAAFFADRLDHLGPRLGMPEVIVGLVTALAADAPELASAVVALARGEKEIGLGVVIGASAFNFATMIGVSVLVAGTVAIGRRALAMEAVVGLTAVAAAALVVFRVLSPWVALLLLAAVVAPYLVHSSRRPAVHTHRGPDRGTAVWASAALVVPAVCLIVAGSIGMVRTAVLLADRWGVSKAIVGVLLLAVLTSLPNGLTGIRLGIAGRGEAVVSETLGSNTINLLGGLLIPALVIGVASRSGLAEFGVAWLAGMTVLAVALLWRGIGRAGGVLLIGAYVAFAVVQLLYG